MRRVAAAIVIAATISVAAPSTAFASDCPPGAWTDCYGTMIAAAIVIAAIAIFAGFMLPEMLVAADAIDAVMISRGMVFAEGALVDAQAAGVAAAATAALAETAGSAEVAVASIETGEAAAASMRAAQAALAMARGAQVLYEMGETTEALAQTARALELAAEAHNLGQTALQLSADATELAQALETGGALSESIISTATQFARALSDAVGDGNPEMIRTLIEGMADRPEGPEVLDVIQRWIAHTMTSGVEMSGAEANGFKTLLGFLRVFR